MNPMNFGISPVVMVCGYVFAIICFCVSMYCRLSRGTTNDFLTKMKEVDEAHARKMWKKVKKAKLEDEFKKVFGL